MGGSIKAKMSTMKRARAASPLPWVENQGMIDTLTAHLGDPDSLG
jgi:hypothetical protein